MSITEGDHAQDGEHEPGDKAGARLGRGGGDGDGARDEVDDGEYAGELDEAELEEEPARGEAGPEVVHQVGEAVGLLGGFRLWFCVVVVVLLEGADVEDMVGWFQFQFHSMSSSEARWGLFDYGKHKRPLTMACRKTRAA